MNTSDLDRIRTARAEIRADLTGARRALVGARRKHALDVGLRQAAWTFTALAGFHFVWAALAVLVGVPGPALSAWGALAFSALVALLPVPVRVYFAGGQAVDLGEVAERVDLAAGNRNRIATALDLSARAGAAPAGVDAFTAAAVEDGVTAARAGAATRPVLPARRSPGLAEAAATYGGVLMLAVAAFLPASGHADEPLPGDNGDGAQQVAKRPPAGSPPVDTPVVAPAVPRPEGHEPAPTGARETTSGEGRVRSAPDTAGRRAPAAGKPGRGKSGQAREARQASVSRGDPTEGKTPPSADRSKPRELKKRKPKKKPSAARMVGKKKQEGEQAGATVGQGGSGGGAMSPVKSPWKQRDRTNDEPLPENPSDEDVEDEISEEEARGGTQPHLRDRKAATSRDLSISAPGEGGEGRGGPTPHKKARGTAAMVLGVPVPDFVRGLLNPGTTKVTHERVQPVTSPGKAHQAATPAGRRGLEPAVRASRVPADQLEAVRRYLRALHRTVKTQPSAAKPTEK